MYEYVSVFNLPITTWATQLQTGYIIGMFLRLKYFFLMLLPVDTWKNVRYSYSLVCLDRITRLQRDQPKVSFGLTFVDFPTLFELTPSFSSSIIQDTKALRDAGRASMVYFYFDLRDVDKQNLRNLFPLSSYNSPLPTLFCTRSRSTGTW